MELRDLQGLFPGQAGEDGGQTSGQHGLARPRRADEQNVVAAGGRHFQGPPGLGLPPDLGEVHPVPRCLGRFACEGRGRIPRAAEEPGDLGEASGPNDPHSLHQRGLAGVRRGDHDTVQAGAGRGDGHREHAWGGHQATPQGELPEEREPGQPVARDLSRCGKHAQGDGEVQSRPVLPEIPRGQVHHDPAERPLQARALDGRPDAIPGVLHGRAGQARQCERGKPSADVRLDRDRVSSHPDDGDPDDAPVHRATLARGTDSQNASSNSSTLASRAPT